MRRETVNDFREVNGVKDKATTRSAGRIAWIEAKVDVWLKNKADARALEKV